MKIAIFGENNFSREISTKIQDNNPETFCFSLNSAIPEKEYFFDFDLFILTEWFKEINYFADISDFKSDPIFLGITDSISYSHSFSNLFGKFYVDALESLFAPKQFIISEISDPVLEEKFAISLNLLEKCGSEIIFSKQISVERWIKLQWNCSIESLSFLEKKTKMEILSNTEMRSRVIKLMIEVSRVGKSEGIRFPDNLINQLLKIPFKNSELKTKEKFDFEQNNGYLIAVSQKKNLKIPENERLYSELKN